MLKAVIFDFDGVIADTYDLNLQVYRHFYPDVTKKEFEDLHAGNPLHKRDWTDRHAEIFAQKQANLFTKEHFFTEVGNLIKSLANEFKLFIISSSADENIKQYLSLKDLDQYFIKVLGANTHKSKESKFKMIFEEYGFKPDEVVFITDTTGDIQEAQKVGVPTIAVTWGYHDRKRLEEARPDHVVDSVEELREAILAYIN